MQPLLKKVRELMGEVDSASRTIDLAAKKRQLAALEIEVNAPEIWNDPARATLKNQQFSKLKNSIEPWETLAVQLHDIGELLEMGDDELLEEFRGQIDALEQQFSELQKEIHFSGPYDNHDVVLRISAGVGGLDAQDFAAMLERMYLRYAEQQLFSSTTIERSTSDEAGIKTSVITLSGPYAYGKLKSEHGVHRLVRLSPFNSDNLRQTSFALVEILPQIDEPDEVKLEDSELKIDVYRAGGHGGQSVNTTDSAVRVTHLPTGIVVAIQNERSQLQNKETALKILRSKLTQLRLEQHADSISELQAGESASWGAQIRNYVLHPYSLVKDTRTKHEDRDTQKVLDGKIDGFIDAYLTQQAEKN
ncbi:peptide chain release factor 2 [Candidatus Saccharibacteria bacterium]|nr:peptide chain release factor 2 [Candidatus Saccharibacteria bacterium]